ncbi:MAG TPA: hypothetical protein VFN51_00450 [Candidatus Saccharimonadales bacterium]|nr:hypothetical protein [Candidatus Saccharimonadales bacterium]
MYAVVFHAHQKLDKVAYRHLLEVKPESRFFPSLEQIIYFDGGNGPDATKLKKQAEVDQPWHFVDPTDENDDKLHKQIQWHYQELVRNLKDKDEIRSAFEAAWLAHALVDGLTPAHHYPYEKELELLRGEGRQTRKGIFGRSFIKGETLTQSIVKSLKLVGPKGLLTTHAMFEAGAYAIIAPLKIASALPTPDDIAQVVCEGVLAEFKRFSREIADLDLYRKFYITGWTRPLSLDIKQQLAPRMVKMVTLAWYAAIEEAAAA